MSGAALVWCPFPDLESARAAADALLDDGLVACANILGSIESRFVWEGARATGSEMAVLFKTTSAALDDVIERLGALHPYDTPAIIGWHADAAHPATLAWLGGGVSG
ncbi:MAG: divalent-cation tolerance protein CutA [Porphyrobacter sp.]|nr:divalent-cation tolerance protein CutA [Porphyrobacter sp.]